MSYKVVPSLRASVLKNDKRKGWQVVAGKQDSWKASTYLHLVLRSMYSGSCWPRLDVKTFSMVNHTGLHPELSLRPNMPARCANCGWR